MPTAPRADNEGRQPKCNRQFLVATALLPQPVVCHNHPNHEKADAMSFRDVLRHEKSPRGTSTPTGLKRLKTQNTAFRGNENGRGTPSGVPQPIHKRKLVLVKEEFDASSFGGGAENRTPVHGRKSRGVYRLSRCSSRKVTRHTDKRGDLPPVQAWLAAYRLRPRVQSPDNDPVRMPEIEHAVGRAEPKLGSQGDSVALCALERNNFAS